MVATVPAVTIAPLARGVGGKVRPDSRYFPYYTRPWIGDQDFDPGRDLALTEQRHRDHLVGGLTALGVKDLLKPGRALLIVRSTGSDCEEPALLVRSTEGLV